MLIADSLQAGCSVIVLIAMAHTASAAVPGQQPNPQPDPGPTPADDDTGMPPADEGSEGRDDERPGRTATRWAA